MAEICLRLLPLLFLLSRISNLVADQPNNLINELDEQTSKPDWYSLFEAKSLEILESISSLKLQNQQVQSMIAKISAVETHLEILRTETKKAISETNGIISEISNTIKSGILSGSGKPFPPATSRQHTNCSSYKPNYEFVPSSELSANEFFNDTETFNGDTICKVFVDGDDLLGRGRRGACWVSLSSGEWGINYGFYLLRQPKGVKLRLRNDILNGVQDWGKAEELLVKEHAINVASSGNLRRGYAGVCNEGIPGEKPPNQVNPQYPIRGYLDAQSPNNLIYTYYFANYNCRNFSILTCTNMEF